MGKHLWQRVTLVALLLVTPLAGCTQETRQVSIAELTSGSEPSRGEVKVAGAIAEQPEPVLSGDLSFRLESEDGSASVGVTFPIPDGYRVPEGDLRGRIVVVVGKYDEGALMATDLIFKTTGPYHSEPPPAD